MMDLHFCHFHIPSKSRNTEKTIKSFKYTVSTKIWRFGFSSISQPNLGQITTSGTVLKTAGSQLSKTFPEIEIGPKISWEKWGRSHIFTLKLSFFAIIFHTQCLFLHFSQQIFGQISISGTVLETTGSQLSKTVPEIEIWPNICWEKWGKSHWVSKIIAKKNSFWE